MQASSPEASSDSANRPLIRRGNAWKALLLASLIPLTAAAPALGPAVANPAPDPNKAGLIEKKLVPDLLGTMQKLRIPGAIVSVTMAKWGTTTTALGTDNLGTGQRIDAADHVRVGDITRTFTGTVILQLADAHRLGLDEPVARLVPGVPNGRNITVRQLLHMTSGLFDYAEDQGLNQTLTQHPETQFAPKDLLAVAFKHQPYFAPGKAFHSSATDAVLLGMIAERVTHQSLQTLFQQRIFAPLGMKDTRIDSSTAIPAPAARGYQHVSNAAALTAPVLTGKDAAWADYSAGKPADVTTANASWTWAAGAATSTVADLNRWVPALATGKLLSAKMHKEQLKFTATSAPTSTTGASMSATSTAAAPAVPTTPTTPTAMTYGLALADYAGLLGHEGRIRGYSSFIGYDPVKQATVVVLANSDRSPDGTTPASELTKRVLADVFGG
ncbi:beta-lactamase family protein [Streptomyces cocklensis]|uniref:serine hydrolase domain-containing protein n=1 Tax=Actinacidiphila cocklensis TaxID=887465 RepID=UPI00203D7852|nr:serine hydrolase domain-containing protein [Actinacidiphila cocklensis]MDD1056759.1 beta-lactamase family protein [Actinacidiphila cocklensis]